MYWHFVDAVWVVIFSIVYLWAIHMNAVGKPARRVGFRSVDCDRLHRAARGVCIARTVAIYRARRGSSRGVAVMFLALVSPLDALRLTYLFSAHMLQHLLLILVVPPLLILGAAANSCGGPRPCRCSRESNASCASPLSHGRSRWRSFGSGTGPRSTTRPSPTSTCTSVEHLCFLVTATIFWWPIFAPRATLAAASRCWRCIYLAPRWSRAACSAILLTFTKPGLYPAYLHPTDSLGILPMLRDGWGLTPGGRSATRRPSDVGAGRSGFSRRDYVCDGPVVFGTRGAKPYRRCWRDREDELMASDTDQIDAKVAHGWTAPKPARDARAHLSARGDGAGDRVRGVWAGYFVRFFPVGLILFAFALSRWIGELVHDE